MDIWICGEKYSDKKNEMPTMAISNWGESDKPKL